MNDQLKKRLIGAVILLVLAVGFLPIILDGSGAVKKLLQVEMSTPKPPVVKPDLYLPDPVLAKPLTLVGIQADQSTETKEDDSSYQTTELVEPRSEPLVKLNSKSEFSAWVVQFGSFSSLNKAQALQNHLRKLDYTAFIRKVTDSDEVLYRVKIGPEITRKLAEKIKSKLKEQEDMDSIVVVHTG